MQRELTYDITFGDCDPAGIAYYPNAFRWMDSAFHNMLRRFGGHAEVCRKMDAIGLDLVDASAQFRIPMHDGDHLELRIKNMEWSRRSMTLSYEAVVGAAVTFSGREVRCLFRKNETGIIAAELTQLRTLLEQHDV